MERVRRFSFSEDRGFDGFGICSGAAPGYESEKSLKIWAIGKIEQINKDMGRDGDGKFPVF